MRGPRSGQAFFSIALLVTGTACNLIAGINDGVLVDAGNDGRTATDAHRGDSRADDTGSSGDAGTKHDAPLPPRDAGADVGEKRDAGSDAGHPSDSSSPPPVLACTLVGSPTLVDDLSNPADAGPSQYNPAIFVAPANAGAGFLIIAQNVTDTTGFLEYLPTGTPLTFGSIQYTGSPVATGVTLLDLETLNPGPDESIQALLSWSVPGTHNNGTYGLEVFDLGSGGNQAGASFIIATDGIFMSRGTFTDARLVNLPVDGGFSGAAVAYRSPAFALGAETALDVVAANARADAGVTQELTLGTAPGSSAIVFNSGDVFFVAGGVVGAVIGPTSFVSDGTDGGYFSVETASTLTADAATLGVVSPTATPPQAGALLAGHASVSHPGNVLLHAASLEMNGTQTRVYSGVVTPAQLQSGLVLGAAPFTTGPGNVLPASSPLLDSIAPPNNGAISWDGDDLAALGPDQSQKKVVLTWLAPDGRVVANSEWMGAGGDVGQCAVEFRSLTSEAGGATFDVAWVEHLSTVGGTSIFDRLYAAEVTCSPTDGG